MPVQTDSPSSEPSVHIHGVQRRDPGRGHEKGAGPRRAGVLPAQPGGQHRGLCRPCEPDGARCPGGHCPRQDDGGGSIFCKEKIPLRLLHVDPSANANQLYAVRLALPVNTEIAATPGMNATVEVAMRQETEASVEIPASALFSNGDKTSYVWNHSLRLVSFYYSNIRSSTSSSVVRISRKAARACSCTRFASVYCLPSIMT